MIRGISDYALDCFDGSRYAGELRRVDDVETPVLEHRFFIDLVIR